MIPKALLKLIKPLVNRMGIDVVRYQSPHFRNDLPQDFDNITVDIIRKVEQFTQTSPERLLALCEAVKYVVANQIPGDIVECGVWEGGSMMAAAQMLLFLGECKRHLHLFDTFEGMTEPSDADISLNGVTASDLLDVSQKHDRNSVWCYASLEQVQANMSSVGYDTQKIHFVKGKVEDTIPEQAPKSIAVLRLDTDWYESTRHEMNHLFPRLSPGGVLIIDDYGHWQGARKAVDDYIQENKVKILLNRIDYTGRIGVAWVDS